MGGTSLKYSATYKEGVFNAREAGAYKFANFTIKDYATVTFETTGKALQLTILELHYGSTLKGEKILLQSNEITLQPGSTIDLSGGGYYQLVHMVNPCVMFFLHMGNL
jgi:hypothetical protein